MKLLPICECIGLQYQSFLMAQLANNRWNPDISYFSILLDIIYIAPLLNMPSGQYLRSSQSSSGIAFAFCIFFTLYKASLLQPDTECLMAILPVDDGVCNPTHKAGTQPTTALLGKQLPFTNPHFTKWFHLSLRRKGVGESLHACFFKVWMGFFFLPRTYPTPQFVLSASGWATTVFSSPILPYLVQSANKEPQSKTICLCFCKGHSVFSNTNAKLNKLCKNVHELVQIIFFLLQYLILTIMLWFRKQIVKLAKAQRNKFCSQSRCSGIFFKPPSFPPSICLRPSLFKNGLSRLKTSSGYTTYLNIAQGHITGWSCPDKSQGILTE